MTNGEKYKDAQASGYAFTHFCNVQKSCRVCPAFNYEDSERGCNFRWLDLETDVENPLPCPFCGNDVEFDENSNVFNCTSCNYMSSGQLMNESAIAAHNRVAKAVMESKKGGAE